MSFVPYFDDLIKVQTHAIKSYKTTFVVLLMIGCVIVVVSVCLFLGTLKGIAPDFIKLGAGFFTAAISVLPFKEIAPRRERIVSFVFLKSRFEQFDSLSLEDQKVLTQMAIDTVKETTKR